MVIETAGVLPCWLTTITLCGYTSLAAQQAFLLSDRILFRFSTRAFIYFIL